MRLTIMELLFGFSASAISECVNSMLTWLESK